MTEDEFIRDVKTDPLTAMVQRMYADAWAMGYEAARKDVMDLAKDDRGMVERDHTLAPAVDRLYAEDGSDLRNRAMRELFDRKQKAEAEMIVAIAALGRQHPDLLPR